MNGLKKVGIVMVSVVAVTLAAITLALFYGCFDHGQFEVEEANWSPSAPARVAVVAKRSDHQALSSDVYFVLVGDHVFSPRELRTAYHGDHVLFAAASDCLSVHWTDAQNLTVICRDGNIDSNHIEVLKRKTGNVAVTYVNVANSTGQ
jgi:hypothetical protein